MDATSVILFSAVSLIAAVVLLVSHVRAWRTYRQQQLDPEDYDYRRRQFRRRMQTSAMLAILAVALLVGYLLMLWIRSSLFATVFWIIVMLVTCWVALLAMVDIWATKHHFSRMRDRCLVEQAKLQAEARRIQAVRGNGKAGKKDIGLGDQRAENAGR